MTIDTVDKQSGSKQTLGFQAEVRQLLQLMNLSLQQPGSLN